MAQYWKSTALAAETLGFLLSAGAILTAARSGAGSNAIPVGVVGGGCVNEGCPRSAEESRTFCATCGLERELFWRDARQRGFGAAATPRQQPMIR